MISLPEVDYLAQVFQDLNLCWEGHFS